MKDSGSEEVPLLRWVFARQAQRVHCELSVDHRHLLYELRTRPVAGPGAETVEPFIDVADAFRRQSEWEAVLVGDGWSLVDYGRVRQHQPS